MRTKNREESDRAKGKKKTTTTNERGREKRKLLLFQLDDKGIKACSLLCRFDSHASGAFSAVSLRCTASALVSFLSSPAQRARQSKRSGTSDAGREISQRESETISFFFSSTILPIFMPLQQRYLPSAWDRGGLLGPRGNARFLEVDGLRVKYIGRLVILE